MYIYIYINIHICIYIYTYIASDCGSLRTSCVAPLGDQPAGGGSICRIKWLKPRGSNPSEKYQAPYGWIWRMA